ncbi:RNA polymerase sigma-70 factor [Dyadobacter sp. LHD-138]|uniref:RNA polymerase sigma-70 factor n=1 Tax=Dyadobacter sp. LHD-138 TaxID=3071413 RepID=UPI0027DFB097|nr:RNA polymerase sigma-70 factor [Dyadobacter sp. LHD-138]MDQ6480708.1 RNA polymerase sigma-70 factor [Dyadobacter sp. LHD-138]
MQNKDLIEVSGEKGLIQTDTIPEADSDKPVDKEFFIRSIFRTDVKKGYDLLFRHYYTPLCSHAVRYVYSKEVAEDIVSEVFLSFWKNAVHEHITTSFRAYLFISVRNKCLNYLKWELNRETSEELDEVTLESVHIQPDRLMEFDELYMRIERIIAGFPPQNQKVFLMSRFGGKSYQEIGEILQISKKAVEAHISKALVEFRKVLKNPNMLIIASLSGLL